MIYLDNAATSFPKPQTVYKAVKKCLESYCGNPGRGAHRLSAVSGEKIYEARELLSAFFGSSLPENVVFTYNDTYALNMAIKGIVKKGDHVIIGDMEHNSVYRPIEAMRAAGIIEYDIFDSMCLSPVRSTERILSGIDRLIKKNTRALICSHVSNICSAELPIEAIGALCRARGIIFILDGAQSAGHLPIDMEKMNIDILCAPGHKGLFGIQGCGFMILGDNISPEPIIHGGSGVNSLSPYMPETSPERFEAGTLSVPSIISLCEGVRFVSEVGLEGIRKHENRLFIRLSDMLFSIPEVRIYASGNRGHTLLFNIRGIPSEQVARKLDENGICVRSGFHCSPLGHKVLETGENGAVRISFSIFNKEKELDRVYSLIKGMSKS